jgi:raffinose/stachyose/melibiose transport system permease protein
MNKSPVPFFRRNSIRKYLTRAIQYLVLSIVAIAILIPIVMLVFGALKTRGEFMTQPYNPPIPPNFNNCITILESPSFWNMLMNSVIVMVGATLGVLVVCSMAAFVFARLKFRHKDVVFNFLTLALMFPINIAILPVYLLIREMGMTDQLISVILVQVAFQISANIMILRGFFMAIPNDLQDAAYVDGCSAFDFYWRILLPLARPALGAVAALTMISSWNDLLTPLVLIDKDSLWTLPLGTMQFHGEYSTDLSMVAAFVALSAVPTVIFYLLAERQIVSGLTAGAVKG